MNATLIMCKSKWHSVISESLKTRGWQVNSYSSLRELLSSPESAEHQDLLISELKMYDDEGGRLSFLLRSAEFPSLQNTPVLMVSDLYSDEYGSAIAHSMGADEYIQLTGDLDKFVLLAEDLVGRDRKKVASSTVLIIEDDPVVSQLIVKKFLANHWQVGTATTVENALEKISRSFYDLAIIDYHLPDGKGDVLLTEIHESSPETTTIMITADATPERAVEWMDRGASAYLLKPFAPHYLYETGIRCLREKMWRGVEQQLEERTRELREREKLVKDFENTIVDVLWRRDLDLRYTYVSPSVEKMTGQSIDSILSMELHEEMTIDSAERFKEVVAEELAKVTADPVTRSPRRDIFEMRYRDNSTFLAEISLGIITAETGFPVAVVGITKDVSMDKANEERLTSLYSAISQADDVIIVTDSQGRLEFANDSFTRVTGYDPKDFMGQDINMLTSGAHDERFYRSLWSDITKGYNWAGQVTNRRKDGSVYQERVKISPIRNRKNEIVRFVAVKHDLTNELAMVSEKEEIEAKYMQVQKLEAIGVLAMGIIHDFNNILTPIVGYANLIKLRYQDDNLIQNHIDQILLAGERAKDLVKQILSFSRVRPEKQQSIALHTLIKESVKMARAFLPPKISIDCNITGEYPEVLIDPTRFSQLFMNLVTNSFHAMERTGGNLSIELQVCGNETHGRVLQLRVADSGSGIADTDLDRIFDPFFTTKEEGKGTGLGLSVCKSIVLEAGGDIGVEFSSPESGTSILVTLPVYNYQENRPPVERQKSSRFNGQGRQVMLVDDDPLVLDYLTTALRRLNFSVESFSDSQEAIRIFSKSTQSYSLLFTDIEMPNKDGFQLIDGLRRMSQGLPVIVCTGNDESEVESSLKEIENIEILKKPVTLNDLSMALSRTFTEVSHDSLAV